MNWSFYFKDVAIIGSRYLIITSIAFFICYVVLRRMIRSKKIQQRFPEFKDYAREIIFSVLTIFVMAFIPALVLGSPEMARHTKFYRDINQQGTAYFIFAFPIMAFMHDTYFYWMHRLMHHPSIFKIVHLVHHKSTNPSPFAAYAFHPLEAIVEAGIFLVFVFTIPVHLFHLLFFFLFMIVYNVYGHLGWELYPKGFSRHWLGKWINTSINHNMHHQYFKGNYGLYFLFWDRMMGTIRKDYDDHFDEVKNRTVPAPIAKPQL
ncbi:MAG: sterol desaturase family protein [Chitinophagaceae bacterium]|nr:sterol desaturase family protein [Chitinophagaceae bacterium]